MSWGSSAGGRIIAPPFDMVDGTAVLNTALSLFPRTVVAEDSATSQSGFQQLGHALLLASNDEPQVLFVGGLERMSQGLTEFQREFWSPLYDALQAVWPRAAKPSRPTIVLAWDQALGNPLPVGVTSDMEISDKVPDVSDRMDFRMLLAHPELGEFELTDIERWLRDRGIKGADLDALAQRVFGTGGIPGLVYERLRQEVFLGGLGGRP